MSDINSIKTTGQVGINTNKPVNARANPNDNKLQEQNTNAASTDSVSLTSTATHLQSLQQKLADTPEVDSDRVSAIRAAIDAGTHSVDPAELANNMINFEQALG